MFGIDGARYREIARMNRNTNGTKFLLLKAAEEASELATAILQHLSKGGSLERVLQEMVDVHLTMSNLLSFLPEETMREYAQLKVKLILAHIEQTRLDRATQPESATAQQAPSRERDCSRNCDSCLADDEDRRDLPHGGVLL